MAESESEELNVVTIQETANEIVALDDRRREIFEEEFEAFDGGAIDDFEETRAVLREQRSEIASLEGILEYERTKIQELEEHTEYLRTEQATRNRSQTLEKLREHNRRMEEFCEELSVAIDAIESNLDVMRTDGPDTDLADPQEHLDRSREAIDAHNESIEGLDENLRILTTYIQ